MIANYNRSVGLGVGAGTLLECWLSTQKPGPTMKANDDAVRSRKVNFSESSQLYVYEPEDESLLKSLAYTKEEQDEFGKDSLLEGFRIKALIEKAPQETAAGSLKYLIRNQIISKAELVGIENYILGKPSGVSKLRQEHSAIVLRKQNEQRKQKVQDPINLGKVAQISSIQSMQRAKIRAAMAA